MEIICAPWGYINQMPICDISRALAISVIGPICRIKRHHRGRGEWSRLSTMGLDETIHPRIALFVELEPDTGLPKKDVAVCPTCAETRSARRTLRSVT